jgi:hypothetical protein
VIGYPVFHLFARACGLLWFGSTLGLEQPTSVLLRQCEVPGGAMSHSRTFTTFISLVLIATGLLAVQSASAASPAVVAAAGDIACPAGDTKDATHCHYRETSNIAVAMNPAAVLALGDLQYNSGVLSDFRTAYDSSWGRLKTRTRPVLGNHEYGTGGASGYFNYFGSRATPRNPDCRSECGGYYSFNVGSWHVVALNSNCGRPNVSCVAGGAQEKWLRADLAAHRNRCTMAIMHHALWASSALKETRVRPFVNALYAANADLIVTAHAHYYERFHPQNSLGQRDNARGLTEFIVGTGGRDFAAKPGSTAGNSAVLKTGAFGALRLSLASTSFSWSFRADPSTPFTDSGSRTCH